MEDHFCVQVPVLPERRLQWLPGPGFDRRDDYRKVLQLVHIGTIWSTGKVKVHVKPCYWCHYMCDSESKSGLE